MTLVGQSSLLALLKSLLLLGAFLVCFKIPQYSRAGIPCELLGLKLREVSLSDQSACDAFSVHC